MIARTKWTVLLAAATVLLPATGRGANVFQMGSGLTSLEFVTVGDPGNVADTRYHTPGYGNVDYTYRIGKYEVTNAQYAEFLNAVAITDTYGLYDTNMGGGWNDIGGITRNGASGSYAYEVRENRANLPVVYVNWYSTLRYANWLQNGQPTGVGQVASSTEDGAYDMSLGRYVVRNSDARYFLPNDHELYKAAYYKGGGTDTGYWNYATQSDTTPTTIAANYYDGGYVDPTYYTTPVGAYAAPSAYGAFDLNGNVYEWNEFDYFGDWHGYHSRGIQGGSFANAADAMHAYARPYDDPEEGGRYTLGFRMASVANPVPEPSSLVLWAGLGVMALVRLRRRRD